MKKRAASFVMRGPEGSAPITGPGRPDITLPLLTDHWRTVRGLRHQTCLTGHIKKRPVQIKTVYSMNVFHGGMSFSLNRIVIHSKPTDLLVSSNLTWPCPRQKWKQPYFIIFRMKKKPLHSTYHETLILCFWSEGMGRSNLVNSSMNSIYKTCFCLVSQEHCRPVSVRV